MNTVPDYQAAFIAVLGWGADGLAGAIAYPIGAAVGAVAVGWMRFAWGRFGPDRKTTVWPDDSTWPED